MKAVGVLQMGLWEKFLLNRISYKVIQAINKDWKGNLATECIQAHRYLQLHLVWNASRTTSTQCSHFKCNVSNYLISAPVVQGDDGDAKDNSRPGEVSSNGISEDMERIQAREVAFWLGSPVSFTDYAWLSIYVTTQQLLVSSHFFKGLKTP